MPQAEPGNTVVGIFEVERLGPTTWRIRNLHYDYTYVTYGPWEEVHDQLIAQTEAWQRRLGKKEHGGAWRHRMTLTKST